MVTNLINKRKLCRLFVIMIGFAIVIVGLFLMYFLYTFERMDLETLHKLFSNDKVSIDMTNCKLKIFDHSEQNPLGSMFMGYYDYDKVKTETDKITVSYVFPKNKNNHFLPLLDLNDKISDTKKIIARNDVYTT